MGQQTGNPMESFLATEGAIALAGSNNSQGVEALKRNLKNKKGFSPSVIIPFKLTDNLANTATDVFTFRFHDDVVILAIDFYKPVYAPELETVTTSGTLTEHVHVLNDIQIKAHVNDTMILPAGGEVVSGGGGEYAWAPCCCVASDFPMWNLAALRANDDYFVLEVNPTTTLSGIYIGVLYGIDLDMRRLV